MRIPTTTASAPAVRIFVSLLDPGEYGLRMETTKSVWTSEIDMDADQLLVMCGLAGHALHHELGPQWVPSADAITVMLPPEMAAAQADALHGAIVRAIHAGFTKAGDKPQAGFL